MNPTIANIPILLMLALTLSVSSLPASEDNALETYLNANYKNDNYELIQILTEDFDGDGAEETVVSYGYPSKSGYNDPVIEENLLLRKEGETYIELKENIYEGGYYVSQVDKVKLDSSDKWYIRLTITNGVSFSGCGVYGIEGDELRVYYQGASAIARGDDYLIDRDEDGVYERVCQERRYHDVQWHTIRQYQKWNGSEFLPSGTGISYSAGEFVHPQEPKEVIEAYIEAVFLNLEKEIGQLLSEGAEIQADVLELCNEDMLIYSGAEMYLDYEVLERNDTKQVIKATSELGTMHFELVHDGKWQIRRVYRVTE